jgi:phage terminase large subunit-like protein
MLGGRGAGKTRAGAEWIRSRVEQAGGANTARRIALIGETYSEARAVMVEGPSGLLSVSPPDWRPKFLPSRHLLVWPNGAEARLFSSERPEALRGPQFDTAWCDELAKWRYDEATWDMLQFGLRLGQQPRQMITTTPRPTALLKRLIDDASCALTRAATMDNRANLAPGFIDHVVGRYVGTALGRQELDGDLVEEVQGALWHRALLDSCRCTGPPPLSQTVVALDPPVGHGPNADACGIIIIGLAESGDAYVLADHSVRGLSPSQWAARVSVSRLLALFLGILVSPRA